MTVRLSSARRLGDLATELGGSVDRGAEDLVVPAIATSDEGGADALGALRPVLRIAAISSAISLDPTAPLLVDRAIAERVPEGRRWVHPRPTFVLARLLPRAPLPETERSLARIERGAHVAESARIGAYAVIRSGARIGEDTVVSAHSVIEGDVVIGARCFIGSHAVIGREGFGWDGDGAALRRIPQRGGVVIEDDVEIGAHGTVDAGTIGPTIIRRGAKLDAHVHVGHNAEVGVFCVLAAQVGLAGSVRLGAGVRVGGQAGFADHVRVGEGARIAAKAGVIGDVPPFATVAGYPAVSRVRWLRGVARTLQAAARRPQRP